MTTRTLPKSYIQSPPTAGLPRLVHKVRRYALGPLFTPAHWLWAHRYGTPGLSFHAWAARFGAGLIFGRKAPLPLGWAFNFIFSPMDSTRYFEFDFAWNALAAAADQGKVHRYLDVSSPRLVPTRLVDSYPQISADLINPDGKDLTLTGEILAAAGLADRCHLHDCTITEAAFAPESFDTITSISVIEHIPEDSAAVESMWRLLAPGGRLILTVPCAAQASEQVINFNEYGLLTPDEAGYVFWQRFYDTVELEERIFRVIGRPQRSRIYGEKQAGLFQKNANRKRTDYATTYPFWREPTMMGQEYAYFDRIEDLPGEGVFAMEFVKA